MSERRGAGSCFEECIKEGGGGATRLGGQWKRSGRGTKTLLKTELYVRGCKTNDIVWPWFSLIMRELMLTMRVKFLSHDDAGT